MAGIERKKVYPMPNRGLNNKLNPVVLKDNEASVLLNARVNETGFLEKHPGYIVDHSPFPNDADSFIRMAVNFKRGTSVDALILAAQDDGNTNATYKVDFKKSTGDGTSDYIGHTLGTSATCTNGSANVTGIGTTWASHLKAGDKIKLDADTTWAEIQTVTDNTNLVLTAVYADTGGTGAYTARIILDKDYIPRGTVFNNKIIITNGADTPMTYDNTSVDLVTDTDVPKGRYIEAHKNRVFIASTAGNPSRIFWSRVNDDTDWDASSQEDVFPQDNGTIVSIKSFGDSLIILKNNGKLYQVVGDFGSSAVGQIDYIRRIDSPENIGIISEQTPVVHDGYLYFIAQAGMYRLDQRMFVEYISDDVSALLDNINFALGPSSSKSYFMDTQTQWDNGTHSGTRARTDGKLENMYDEYTQTASTTASYCISCAIDDNDVVHAVYPYEYVRIATDGTKKTLALDTFTRASIAVTPAGKAGVLISNTANCYYYETSTGDSWDATKETVHTSNIVAAGIAFTSGGVATVVDINWFFSNPGSPFYNHHRISCYKRITGVWTLIGTSATWLNTNGVFGTPAPLSFTIDSSDNLAVAHRPISAVTWFTVANSTGQFSSTDGGVTWALDEQPVLGQPTSAQPEIESDSSDNYHTMVTNSSDVIVVRDHNAGSTSNLDTDTASFGQGYALNSSDEIYYLNIKTASPNQVAKHTFETSEVLTSSDANELIKTYYPGDHPLSVNGNGIMAYIAWGSSSNEILIRRIAFRATYLSQIYSDATLSDWGTYDITNEVSNGNTITHSVAAKATSPPDVYDTKTHGQIINSNPAKVFAQAKVQFVLTDLVKSTIDSIEMSYTGTGIDAKQAYGITFDNELFYSLAETSSANNNKVLLRDVEDSFIELDYPVSVMTVYKNKLYAGSASNGDLLILNQGYNFGGSDYTLDMQSREDFLDSIELEKDIYKFYVLYDVKTAGDFTFSYRLDNFATDAGTSWTDEVIDHTEKGIAEINVGNKARSIQWRIQNTVADQVVGVIAVVLVYRFLNVR